jgi:hypothetical protein
MTTAKDGVGWVKVRWDVTGNTNSYRCGADGSYDLAKAPKKKALVPAPPSAKSAKKKSKKSAKSAADAKYVEYAWSPTLVANVPVHKGREGMAGLPGAPGPSGITGQAGEAGERGAMGETGAQGQRGPTGTDWTTSAQPVNKWVVFHLFLVTVLLGLGWLVMSHVSTPKPEKRTPVDDGLEVLIASTYDVASDLRQYNITSSDGIIVRGQNTGRQFTLLFDQTGMPQLDPAPTEADLPLQVVRAKVAVQEQPAAGLESEEQPQEQPQTASM